MNPPSVKYGLKKKDATIVNAGPVPVKLLEEMKAIDIKII
jgi:hypothetical protein